MKERALPSPTTSTRLSHFQVKCCLVFGLVIAGIFIIAEEERERECECVCVWSGGELAKAKKEREGVRWTYQMGQGSNTCCCHFFYWLARMAIGKPYKFIVSYYPVIYVCSFF